MSIIFKGGSVDVTVPVSQKIGISARNGATAIVYYSTFPNSPERYYEQTRITDAYTELGTFTGDKKVRVEAQDGDVLYDVAASPSLSTEYSAAMNQGVATTDSPSFAGLTSTNHMNITAGYAFQTTGTLFYLTAGTTIRVTSTDYVNKILLHTNTGNIDMLTGSLLAAGTKVVGAQGAAVADASGGATVDAECRTAVNDLLARLRTHGLIAT